jgi:hypothetical protein
MIHCIRAVMRIIRWALTNKKLQMVESETVDVPIASLTIPIDKASPRHSTVGLLKRHCRRLPRQLTIDCTLHAPARHLALAGCRVAVRGELAGSIFIDRVVGPTAWPGGDRPPPPLPRCGPVGPTTRMDGLVELRPRYGPLQTTAGLTSMSPPTPLPSPHSRRPVDVKAGCCRTKRCQMDFQAPRCWEGARRAPPPKKTNPTIPTIPRMPNHSIGPPPSSNPSPHY